MSDAIFFASLVALANIAGGMLVTQGARYRDIPLRVLVAFGAGFMLAVAILEMVPGAMAVEHGLSALLIGYLVVHLTQHVLTPHFHFGEETHAEAMGSRHVGTWALIGLVPHSFFDGVAIASGFLIDASLGMLIFFSVLMHKIPTGVSLASIMLASGNSARNALAAVTGVGVATVAGAWITPVVGVLGQYGLGLAAGVTIYVAASNLIPESQREPGLLIPAGVFLGVAAFWAARLLLPGH